MDAIPDGTLLEQLSYAEQLAAILNWIDERVFAPFRAHVEPTTVPRRFPGVKERGYHIQQLITYRVIRPTHWLTRKTLGQDFIESYLVWGEEVEAMARDKLKNGSLRHFGDAELRLLFIAHALIAVRYRVLQNRRFFPVARLRTIASAYRD